MLDQPFRPAADQSLTMGELLSPAGCSIWKLNPPREAILAAAFVGLQIGILILMIVLDGLPLLLGERLVLKVVPVDPRDLLRGDYVVLDYGFNSIPQNHGSAPSQVLGRELYISLRPE